MSAEAPPVVAAAAQLPAAVAPPPPGAKPVDSTIAASTARLTPQQLQKLATADKAREAKLAAQQKMRAAAAPHRRGKASKEKSPFRNGGDKYDPLNAKL